MPRFYRVIQFGVPDLTIVIPAYNEAERLPRTLSATLAYVHERALDAEILVVDDGSADATAQVAASFPGVDVLRSPRNAGKGNAVRQGVMRSQGRRVLYMDADLATPIEELTHLEAALDAGALVAIGSRPLRESELLVRQPWYREMAGRLFNGAVQAVATPGIHDTQCGFKLLDGDTARAIFARCVLDGFSFDVEALFLARRMGCPIAEVPVRWAHQEGAAAFASGGRYLSHGLRMLRDLFRIRWIHRAVRPGSVVPAPVRLP